MESFKTDIAKIEILVFFILIQPDDYLRDEALQLSNVFD